ncbi:MAG: CGNR zinc finger domain-containing protein [Jatrophihabitans sp.]
MLFAHDTETALAITAALVNTDDPDDEGLPDIAALNAFLDAHLLSGARARTRAELDAVHELRPRLRAIWDVADDPATAVTLVNDLLTDTAAAPWLTDHDDWGWHLHLTRPDAPVVHRLGAEAAMGFIDLVRTDELTRLQICAADDCTSVLVDLSRNRSRLYCDTGNCGNRQHVAAYRARNRGK